MGDRLAEIQVRTISDTLAVLYANALVDTLIKRLGEVKVKKNGTKF